MARAYPPGIRRKRDRLEAYVRVDGRLKTRAFPLHTPLRVLKDWRDAARVDLRAGREPVDERAPLGTGATFADDAARYLRIVRAMPTFKDRAYRIAQWSIVFGHRRRADISPLEIRETLERWRKHGAADGGPLTPASLNQRRTALLSMFSTLDGRHMPNPVRAVPPYRETESVLRLPTHDHAQRAIAASAPPRRPGAPMPLTQARLWALYWTGQPAAVLMQIAREDIDPSRGAVVLHGRQKGRGTLPQELYLLPQGIAALVRLANLDGLGKFSTSALYACLHRGCRRAGVRPFRPYDLRHLYLTTIARASKDQRGLSELAAHASPSTTWRYTRHAASERARAVLAESLHAFPATEQTAETAANSGQLPKQLKTISADGPA